MSTPRRCIFGRRRGCDDQILVKRGSPSALPLEVRIPGTPKFTPIERLVVIVMTPAAAFSRLHRMALDWENSWLISEPNRAYKSARMNRLEHSGNRCADGAAGQVEFPLRVAVCAWCKPRDRGATLGALSHGICPRHFREMKIKLQYSLPGREGGPVRPPAHRSRKHKLSTGDVAQLSFPFPGPSVAAAHLSA